MALKFFLVPESASERSPCSSFCKKTVLPWFCQDVGDGRDLIFGNAARGQIFLNISPRKGVSVLASSAPVRAPTPLRGFGTGSQTRPQVLHLTASRPDDRRAPHFAVSRCRHTLRSRQGARAEKPLFFFSRSRKHAAGGLKRAGNIEHEKLTILVEKNTAELPDAVQLIERRKNAMVGDQSDQRILRNPLP